MTQMVIPENQSKIERAFEDFHAKHPEVYLALVDVTRDLKNRGHRRLGIGMVYEVVRWQSMVGHIAGPFKLNNSYRSYYSRRIMEREPDLGGIFNTRELAVPHHRVP